MEYIITPAEYGRYYATLPRKAGARGAKANVNAIDTRANINKRIKAGEELPGVLSIRKVGRFNIIRVRKRVWEEVQKIIASNEKINLVE